MFVATMITNPSEPVLTVGNVLPYHRALGGGEFRWLQDGIACEFPLEVVPDGWRNTWQSLQDRGVDLVIQKADGRRKQMLLADMDSTMIQQECIDELADEAGFGERVAAITRRAMNGELVFETALKERVALLAGLPESVIDRVLEGLDSAAAVLPAVPPGIEVALRGDGALVFSYRRSETRAETVLDLLRRAGIAIRDVATEEPDLEDVFVSLTRGRAA